MKNKYLYLFLISVIMMILSGCTLRTSDGFTSDEKSICVLQNGRSARIGNTVLYDCSEDYGTYIKLENSDVSRKLDDVSQNFAIDKISSSNQYFYLSGREISDVWGGKTNVLVMDVNGKIIAAKECCCDWIYASGSTIFGYYKCRDESEKVLAWEATRMEVTHYQDEEEFLNSAHNNIEEWTPMTGESLSVDGKEWFRQKKDYEHSQNYYTDTVYCDTYYVLEWLNYVTQAHQKGYKVWGLVDNFTADVSTTETLSQLASRQNIIKHLVQTAANIGMDGINVDFESLSEDAGPHFLEFLRELSIECHKNNLVLSVDNPVPEDFTSHYDRREQGLVVDYVVIMGYDEHYVGSDAGSVASLPWVEQGVEDTLAEVPAQRTILAIPFYTRLWKTTGGAVTSEAIGMTEAQNVLTENKVETVWDGSISQNYGEYEKDGSTYQIWMEDAQSIAEKVKLIPKYDLAGVAQWRLGFESNDIWSTISENLQSAS